MAQETSRRSLAGGAVAALLGTAGAIGTTPPREPIANPDGVLVALCCEYIGLSARHLDLCSKQDALPRPLSPAGEAEWSRLDDVVVDLAARLGTLEDQIPEFPATTPAGQKAKAEALLWHMRHTSVHHGGPMARSLARDLLGRA